jgi:virginiamycin A acetyltransferase
MSTYLRNPLTEYLNYLWNRHQNRSRFSNFDQGYMARVKKTVCGANVRVGRESIVFGSSIGSYSYINCHTEIYLTDVGKFCSIGPSCRIGLGIHPTNYVSTCPSFFSTARQNGVTFVTADLVEETKPIRLGNDVWIGANVLVMDGVEIGTGAVVAAGSVVTKNVSPYAIVAGVPAVEKKKRFADSQIQFLLDSKWWDWSSEELERRAGDFLNLDRFIQHLSASGL